MPSLYEALDSSLATQEKNEKRVKSRHVTPVPLLRSNQLREMYFYKRQKNKTCENPPESPEFTLPTSITVIKQWTVTTSKYQSHKQEKVGTTVSGVQEATLIDS